MLQKTATRQTHTVINQPPPLEGYNLFDGDQPLKEAVEREGGSWGLERLQGFGQTLGGEPLEWGNQANKYLPELKTHDRFGNRIDEVEYHPSWHQLFRLGIENELHSLPWNDEQPGAQVLRAAHFMLLGQVEAGVMCPISMTYSAVPALAVSAELEAEWRPKLTVADYDSATICGMALTEKQGGSDVGANTSLAEPSADGTYEITGHKWFCSHPVCDVFLVLARTPDAEPGSRGLSCFLMPRKLPDGSSNGMQIMRLKDKLGTRSLASGEVEFEAATAFLLGDEGRGVKTILEMVNHTRLDCTLGSAAGIRRAVAEAIHHCAFRQAFGRNLIDQPLMQNVLADLCIESEAATATALRLARSYESKQPPHLRRLATPVMKYLICKQAPAVAVEALECLGGNGYVEESVMPRIYRDSQVNSTWEGSGNVIALDVLRAMAREPQSVEAFLKEIELAAGSNTTFDTALSDLRRKIEGLAGEGAELGARALVERMATLFQASLLIQAAGDDVTQAVADAYCASRLEGGSRHFGTLSGGIDLEAVVERNHPRE